MVGGGGWGGVPKSEFSTQCPRFTGEVSVPLAVTFRMLAWVIRPPRTLSAGNATRRILSPEILAMP